jgi:NitT/TauT family transport system substrate-binding protein
MPFFYAEEKGYFREVGLEIEREPISTSDRMIPPLATGELDVGASGFGVGLYNAALRNISFKIIADNGQSAGTSSGALVARQDLLDSGAIRDYADLRGRRLGLQSRGTGVHITIARALEKGGLGFGDVEIVELPFADVSPALANRALDAALQVEPFVAMGVEQGTFGVLRWMDEIYPDQQFNAILYSPQFTTNTDAAGRFMLAYLRGVRDYNEVIRKGRNVEEFAVIGAKYLPIRDASLYPRMRHIGINPDGYLNRPGMEDDLDWYLAQGLMQQRIDLDTLLDYSFVEAAVAKLGPYR